MRKLNSKFKTSFISEEGTYLQNKDYFAFVELDNYACYVIADGIDDDINLESAKLVVTSFIKDFTEKPNMNKFTIKKYLKKANNELLTSGNNTRLKASITVVVTNYNKLIYSVIGNTRFYLFRDGYLNIKSKDQSLTQQLADKDMITLDKMSKHIERNNLANYLGENTLSNPYISKKIKLKDGDVFALLTKGIWENSDEHDIEDALEGVTEAKEVIDNIEEVILSKQPKEIENYTISLTFVDKIYLNPNKGKIFKKVLLIAIPIILILTIVLVTLNIKSNKKRENINTMGQYKVNAEEYIGNNNISKANEEYKKALDIAEKYKLKPDMENLDKDYKYTEIILEADKNLEDKKFEDALDKYILSLEKSGDCEGIGRDYILKKLEVIKKCIKVSDLLTLGDKNLELGNMDDAEKNYKDAKELATDYYLKDEKKQAMDKLQEIYSKKAGDADKQKAEEDKTKEEAIKAKEEVAKVAENNKKQEAENQQKEEESKKEAEKLQNKAIDLRKNGDMQYVAGDYISAKMYYALAKESFEKINSDSLANDLEGKIELMDRKINDVASKKSEADQYASEANNKVLSNDYNSAKVLYNLAKDVYEQLGLTDDINKIKEKLDIVNKSLVNTKSSN